MHIVRTDVLCRMSIFKLLSVIWNVILVAVALSLIHKFKYSIIWAICWFIGKRSFLLTLRKRHAIIVNGIAYCRFFEHD